MKRSGMTEIGRKLFGGSLKHKLDANDSADKEDGEHNRQQVEIAVDPRFYGGTADVHQCGDKVKSGTASDNGGNDERPQRNTASTGCNCKNLVGNRRECRRENRKERIALIKFFDFIEDLFGEAGYISEKEILCCHPKSEADEITEQRPRHGTDQTDGGVPKGSERFADRQSNLQHVRRDRKE